jgi:hypothetical protein
MSDPMAELNNRQLIYSSLLLDSTGGRALLDPQTHASTKQVSASRHTVFRHTLRTCFLPACAAAHPSARRNHGHLRRATRQPSFESGILCT